MRILVVAGLIVVEDRFLVCQRNSSAAFPFKWEFPGGKVERGEEKTDALIRELKEELNIGVTKARQVFRHQHSYSDNRLVDLTFFLVEAFTGSPENRLFNDMRWARVDELGEFDFLEGDLPLIERIRQGEFSCASKGVKVATSGIPTIRS
jgi:8-oxo-dGTP diphosphatase